MNKYFQDFYTIRSVCVRLGEDDVAYFKKEGRKEMFDLTTH